jgi:REP element-mobilizing transposase RayT
MPHAKRSSHVPRHPVHVTLRAAAGLPSLRVPRLFGPVRAAIAAASRDDVRVLQFSVQSDHLHLLMEADESTGLGRGVQGLAIRVAKAVNRVLGRRGRVWGDRYHARMLKTPREVRNALVYVLGNWRKHVPGARGLDPCSSAAWFDGWQGRITRITGAAPVAAARTWLARAGWRRYGLVRPEEMPSRPVGRRRLL